VSAVTIDVGDARLTRVSYAEVDIDPTAVGLTAREVASVAWAAPTWANGTQVRVAAAAWIVEHDGAVIVVDPAGAADDLLRAGDDARVHQEAFAASLAAAGFSRDRVTHAVATHLDGIGMFGWRTGDAWEAFFPDATLLVSRRELDALDEGFDAPGREALFELRAAGVVEPNGERVALTSAVTIEHTGGHNPGHQIVRVESRGARAVHLGHLAVVPLQLVTGPSPGVDPDAAWATLTKLRDEGGVLLGSLWPAPGAGRWRLGAFEPA